MKDKVLKVAIGSLLKLTEDANLWGNVRFFKDYGTATDEEEIFTRVSDLSNTKSDWAQFIFSNFIDRIEIQEDSLDQWFYYEKDAGGNWQPALAKSGESAKEGVYLELIAKLKAQTFADLKKQTARFLAPHEERKRQLVFPQTSDAESYDWEEFLRVNNVAQVDLDCPDGSMNVYSYTRGGWVVKNLMEDEEEDETCEGLKPSQDQGKYIIQFAGRTSLKTYSSVEQALEETKASFADEDECLEQVTVDVFQLVKTVVMRKKTVVEIEED